MKIMFGVSGEKGSFSEEAALKYAKQHKLNPCLVYLIDMEGVLDALGKGNIDLGIFPVVNLQGGLVKTAFDAMGKHLFKYTDELWLHVHQNLLVLPGISFKQISRIVSHPQGFLQCKNYLEKTFDGIQRLDWVNTARAAIDLAEGRLDPSSAVIASKRCAELYGLEVLVENIEDSDLNLTAFVVVKPHLAKEIEQEALLYVND